MKSITITTAAKAKAVMVASLFKPVNGRTLNDEKFDGGKYRTNPETPYIGRVIEVGDCVHAVYTVRRKDSDGAYVQFRCISEGAA